MVPNRMFEVVNAVIVDTKINSSSLLKCIVISLGGGGVYVGK
jgi:hypothetical protein